MSHLYFLRAIRAAPDDDTPRLVYADWLDEYDDAARAEFIRVQCELARGSLDEVRRAALTERECQLLFEHGALWLPPLSDWKSTPRFQRGFPVAGPQGDGWLSVSAFLDHADEWLENWIGPSLMLANRPEEHASNWWSRLLACRHLGLIAGLRFNHVGLRPAHLRALVEHPALTDLEVLDLGDNPFGNAGGRILAEAPWPGLRQLNLSRTGLGPPGLRALVASPHLRQLVRLNLRYNPLGRVGADLLADRKHFPNLTHLAMRATGIGPRGWRALRDRRLDSLTK